MIAQPIRVASSVAASTAPAKNVELSVTSPNAMPGLKKLNLYQTLVSEKGYQDLQLVSNRDSALPNWRSR